MASETPNKDMLILYNGTDAEDWSIYLRGLIDTGMGESVQCDWKDIKNGVTDDINLQKGKYRLLAIFVSPLMLDFLELDTDYLKPFVNAHEHIALIRLFTEQTDLESVIKDGYTSTDRWTVLEVTSNTADNEKMVSELLDKLQVARIPPPGPKLSKSGRNRNSSEKKIASSLVKAVCPSHIKTEGEMVLLVMHKAYENETIQLSFDKDVTKTDTTRLNPYCFQFQSPAHRPGSMSVYVYVDGVKICRTTLKYVKHSVFAYTYPEYISQMLNVDTDAKDLSKLDETLAKMFLSSTPGDSSMDHILSPKNVLTSSGGGHYDEFLPTLLHFACYYGLQELCSCVIDTPGSAITLDIHNSDGKTPLDLAKENNHDSLVEYIELFLEMRDYVGVCEDIYEKMTKQSLEDGYLYMRGASGGVEDYGRGRIPEDDYIIADGHHTIEEVSEEDDITSKPKVPERTHLKPVEQPRLPPKPNPYKRDEDFFKPIPPSPLAMGSSSLGELIDYQEMYKRNELDLGDIERLYEAWNERNKHNRNASVKERKEQMDKLKNEFYKPLRSTANQSLPPRVPTLEIVHNTVPNKYAEWRPGGALGYGSRDSYGSNRDSTTSSSSSGSRDSALGAIREYSDSDNDETPPPVPYRDVRDKTSSSANRNSLGKRFLDNIASTGRVSRLPPVPSIHPPIRKNHSAAPTVPARPPVPSERRKISH